MNMAQMLQLAKQFKQAPNKEKMLNSMVAPQQQDQVNQFQNLNKEQQASKIAEICNQNGISLDQLKSIYNGLK